MTKEEFMTVYHVADKHYSKKKMEHALSVMRYVLDDCRYALMTEEEKRLVAAIALAHDIIEDTKCSWSELQSGIEDDAERRKFYVAIDLLTHRPEVSYDEYIDQIIRSKNLYAIMVKQADMKDHLMRKATLTAKKKAKYEPVLSKLLRA